MKKLCLIGLLLAVLLAACGKGNAPAETVAPATESVAASETEAEFALPVPTVEKDLPPIERKVEFCYSEDGLSALVVGGVSHTVDFPHADYLGFCVRRNVVVGFTDTFLCHVLYFDLDNPTDNSLYTQCMLPSTKDYSPYTVYETDGVIADDTGVLVMNGGEYVTCGIGALRHSGAYWLWEPDYADTCVCDEDFNVILDGVKMADITSDGDILYTVTPDSFVRMTKDREIMSALYRGYTVEALLSDYVLCRQGERFLLVDVDGNTVVDFGEYPGYSTTPYFCAVRENDDGQTTYNAEIYGDNGTLLLCYTPALGEATVKPAYEN